MKNRVGSLDVRGHVLSTPTQPSTIFLDLFYIKKERYSSSGAVEMSKPKRKLEEKILFTTSGYLVQKIEVLHRPRLVDSF